MNAARLDQIDEFWAHGPMIVQESAWSAAAFGLLPVVSPSDYRDWWTARGHALGAPETPTCTTEEHTLCVSEGGKLVLVPTSTLPDEK